MTISALKTYINKLNEKIAMHITLVFGTMWTTYVFFLYGFIPLFFPDSCNQVMYWSGTIQLWSLPLLMVGTNILGREAERRNKEMYEMIKSEMSSTKIQMENLTKRTVGTNPRTTSRPAGANTR